MLRRILFLRRTVLRTSSTINNVEFSSFIDKQKNDLKIDVNKKIVHRGDDGFSYLINGEKKSKDHMIFHVLGVFEELNSLIGLAREFATENDHEYSENLKRVQMCIIDMMTGISKYRRDCPKIIPDIYTTELDEWIAEYSLKLPPPEHFIMPGGGKASSTLHIARSCCRKAERSILPLIQEKITDNTPLIYLNRLSDFLFVISRLAAKIDKRTESVYIPTPDDTTTLNSLLTPEILKNGTLYSQPPDKTKQKQ